MRLDSWLSLAADWEGSRAGGEAVVAPQGLRLPRVPASRAAAPPARLPAQRRAERPSAPRSNAPQLDPRRDRGAPGAGRGWSGRARLARPPGPPRCAATAAKQRCTFAATPDGKRTRPRCTCCVSPRAPV